ncbi:MAG: hypothetical protein FWB75_01120 [Oscillospiraceae bacterium]|nr:hypothetical protein [Oscillospiraceae bacterium]
MGATEMIKSQAVKFSRARGALLSVVVFTLVNLLIEVFGLEFYFLYSAFFPQLVYVMLADFNFAVLGFVLALGITAIYFVCWILSKKRRVFILIAMIIFLMDTLARLGLAALIVFDGGMDIWFIVELVFCAWILISLIGGTVAWSKLRSATPEQFSAAEGEVAKAEETEAVRSVLNTGNSDSDDVPPATE